MYSIRSVKCLIALLTLFGALGCKSDVCDGGANIPAISSASYDRSCAVDADCVAVPEGDVCMDCALSCLQLGVVSKSVEDKYRSDVAKLVEQYPQDVCRCPRSPDPCCVDSVCHHDQTCSQR